MGWLAGGSGASAHAGTRSLTHVKAELPAETVVLSLRCAWIKNVGNSSRADLCWLVGRVVSISWFIVGQLVSLNVQKGDIGFPQRENVRAGARKDALQRTRFMK